MRVGCGLLFLLIAAVLGWAAFNWTHNAQNAKGFGAWLTDEKQTSENFAVRFGVGAAIFGVLALIILGSGGSEPSPKQSSAPIPPSSRGGSSPPTVEERLKNLNGLQARGLISDAEYGKRRQAILDDV